MRSIILFQIVFKFIDVWKWINCFCRVLLVRKIQSCGIFKDIYIYIYL